MAKKVKVNLEFLLVTAVADALGLELNLKAMDMEAT